MAYSSNCCGALSASIQTATRINAIIVAAILFFNVLPSKMQIHSNYTVIRYNMQESYIIDKPPNHLYNYVGFI